MRIAYLIHHDIRGLFGGSEVYAHSLAEEAVAAGHEVVVISRGKNSEQIREKGIHYAILADDELTDPHARFRLRETYDNPLAFKAITKALGDFRPHRLHIHHLLMSSARVVDWAVRRKIVVTATLHDYWAFCHRITWTLPDGSPCPGPQGGMRCRQCGKDKYNRWPGKLLQPAHTLGFVQRNDLLRHAYRQMKAVFVPSRFVLDAHLRHGFAKANLIHQPYGLPAFKRLQNNAPHRPLRVGYIGRLAPEKGVDTLIAAAAIGKSFEIVVYGEGNDAYEKELKQQALDAPVRFAGSFTHDRLADILAEIDVVAVPSRWRENLPLTALEAAAHGVPLLVSNIGGLGETVGLCNAWTVPPDSSEQWAKLLQKLAEDEKRWQTQKSKVHYFQHIKEDLEKQLA